MKSHSAWLLLSLSLLAGCPPPLIPTGEEGDACSSHDDCEEDLVCRDDKEECDDPWGLRWRMTVVSASVPAANADGEAWDNDGTAPDVYITVRLDGVELLTTETRNDSTNPSFNESVVLTPEKSSQLQLTIYDLDFILSEPVQAFIADGRALALKDGNQTMRTSMGNSTVSVVVEWELDE